MAECVILGWLAVLMTVVVSMTLSAHRLNSEDQRRLDTLRWVGRQIDEEREGMGHDAD